MKLKKISNAIVIFSAYMPPHIGGIERYIDNLSKKISEKKIKVIVVTTNFDNSEWYIKEDNIEIIKLPVYNLFKNRYPILKKNKKYKDLMSKLNDYNISSIIVNTRFHLTSHIGANYGKKHGIPVYLIEHGSNYVTLNNKFVDFFANRYEDFLTWMIKKKICGFYGVSNACSEWLKNFNIVANGVWYNSIDIDQKKPQRKNHQGVNFMYAGRIIKQKGVENILNAFSLLEKKIDNIHLFIAGDGPELANYKNRFVSKNITFLGKVNYNCLLEYYAKTDVFLYPPLWPEGLPTSILEAGLMECAVIGTNQGGIIEIIEDKKNGVIVDQNISSLYNAMLNLIENKELIELYSKNLSKTVRKKFSWESTANKILGDIYERQKHK